MKFFFFSFVGILTEVIPSHESEVSFKKFQNINEHELTGYLDFETTHEKTVSLCSRCDEFRTKSVSQKQKQKVTQQCVSENHPKPNQVLCDGCKKEYLLLIESTNCNHPKLKYKMDGVDQIFSTCRNCHEGVLSKVDCKHVKSEVLTDLNAISYNFR